MPGLALLTLRARKGGFAGTFVALLLAAAVLSACGILLESGIRAGSAPERYAAADVVVTGRQEVELTLKDLDGSTVEEARPLTERVPLKASVAGRIALVDGVRTVIVDRGAAVRLATGDGRPVTGRHGAAPEAHTWSGARLGDFRLSAGHAPRTAGELVLDRDTAARSGLRPGDEVLLETASAPRSFELAGLVSPAGGRAPRLPVAFVSDAAMDRLGPVVHAVGVLADPGTPAARAADDIREALDDSTLAVHTGEGRGRAEFLDVTVSGSNLVVLAAAVGGNVLLIAVLVLFGTASLSVRHRRRELALLRAIGTTPGQIRRLVAIEAAVTGLAAGVLGCPLGLLLVHLLRDRFAGHGIVPPDFGLVVGPLPFLGAVLVTVPTALAAVLAASLRVSRIRPTEALGDTAPESRGPGRRRVVTGGVLLVLAAGVFVTGAARDTDFFTLVGLANSLVLLLVIAVAVLGPLVARAAVGLLGPLVGRTGVTGYLAAANTRADALRLAGAIVPLVLAVSFAATVVFAQTTGLRESADQLRSGLVADHVITAPNGVSPELASEVRDLAGVRSATGLVRSQVVGVGTLLGAQEAVSLGAQGVDPRALGEVLDLGTREGDLTALSASTVAVSTTTASWLGLGVGDTARLTLGDGTPFRGRVVAVYERGFGFADVTLDHDLLLAHTTRRADESVLVRSGGPSGGRAGAAVSGLPEALAAVAADHPGAVLRDGLAVDEQLTEQRANAWVNYLVVGLVIAYTGITVVNTLAMGTAARRREFALLRLSGTARRQVAAMMWKESAVVVVAGVGVGTLLSLFPLALVSLAVSGSPWPAVPGLGYLAIAGGTAVLAVAGTMVPTHVLLGIRPVEAIGSKE
ncbi:FtsX-like permease family protein [Streptomyces fructofermentans]|uniref:ABC transporter permease n=1 Tax=Streptomyces fructofermentans TaxID=152141 RepID=A0A918NSU1_9ACTN|nr:ABC transporter permease [Streptomyces fructofermentans]GGX92652.1 ABC transporter permease [Streptomyces fructofermentans]